MPSKVRQMAFSSAWLYIIFIPSLRVVKREAVCKFGSKSLASIVFLSRKARTYNNTRLVVVLTSLIFSFRVLSVIFLIRLLVIS